MEETQVMVTTHDGREIPESESIELHDGSYAHEDDDVVEFGSEYYRSSECSMCDWCDDSVPDNYLRNIGNGNYVCQGCRDNWECFVCCDCGCLLSSEYYDEDGVCQECACALADYSDDSELDFPREEGNGLMFGIELETISNYGIRGAVEDILGCFPRAYVIAKDDGSLSRNGLEIVTRPDSPRVHKRIMAESMERLKDHCAPDHTCGIHIHVGRETLTQMQISKMYCLINEDEFGDIVVTVAGRDGREWAKRSKKKHTSKPYTGGRYEALNLTNVETIEFRIFKSTDDPTVMLSNIEFCESMVAFCAPCQCSYRYMDRDSYLRFVKSHKKDWPNLYNTLKEVY